MGGLLVATTAKTNATCSSNHLYERLLRLMEKLPIASGQRDGDESSCACRGPTLFHNILPILEPFFSLNPRLLFIEDRILGRKRAARNSASFAVPSSLSELQLWTKEAATVCDCDECAPELYQLSEPSSHRAVEMSGAQDMSTVRLPTLRLRLYGEYEAMRLVRHHIAWLDGTYLQDPSPTDISALSQLKTTLETWRPHLSSHDLRQTTSREELQSLFNQINHAFFFNTIPLQRRPFSSSFRWLPETQNTAFATCYYNPLIGTHILLHPIIYRRQPTDNPEQVDVRFRNRFGTILHEMCHAFLKAYTCRSCPMHDHGIGPRGHGRAWQLLAQKIEEVATRVMGGYVNMGRYPSLLNDLSGHGRLPSCHDLELYQLGNEGIEQSNSII